MEFNTVLSWGIIFAIYLGLVYVGGPIHQDFANIAPGILLILSIINGISQLRGYYKKKRHSKAAITT